MVIKDMRKTYLEYVKPGSVCEIDGQAFIRTNNDDYSVVEVRTGSSESLSLKACVVVLDTVEMTIH